MQDLDVTKDSIFGLKKPLGQTTTMADGAVVLFPDLYTNQFGVEEMKERASDPNMGAGMLIEDQSSGKTGLRTTQPSPDLVGPSSGEESPLRHQRLNDRKK